MRSKLNVRKLALFVLVVLHRFAGTGKTTPFAGRRVIRRFNWWVWEREQAVCNLASAAAELAAAALSALSELTASKLARLAGRFQLLSERLYPESGGLRLALLPAAVPYGWDSLDLPEPVRVPAPAIQPLPADVWEEVEKISTEAAAHGPAPAPEPKPTEEVFPQARPKAAAHSAARKQPKAKAVPKAKRDPLREAKYEEARMHMACGDSQKEACRKVGVPESSFRAWRKKQPAKTAAS